MHGAVAAEDQERAIPDVAAAFGGDRTDRAHHGRVRDLEDAVGRLLQRELDAVRDPAQRPLGARLVQRELAPQQGDGIQEAEDEIGIGDGRLGTAAGVTHRPRARARAVRPDAHAAALVDVDDAATAGADFSDVDGGCLQCIAAALQQA